MPANRVTLEVGVAANTSRYQSGMKRVEDSTRRTGQQLERTRRNFDRMGRASRASENAFATLATRVGAAVAGFYVAQRALRGLITTLNDLQNAANALRVVTDSQRELVKVSEELFQAAQRSRSPWLDLITIYRRIAIATNEQGVSSTRLIGIIESLSKSAISSGTNMSELRAGLIQLSQGLGAGALRGDEFRSVMENLPGVARAIAAGLGVSVGHLRELSQQGQLTTQVIIDALEASEGLIDNQFGRTTATISQAWTEVTNEVLRSVEALDTFLGVSRAIATFLGGIADVIAVTRSGDIFVRGATGADGEERSTGARAASAIANIGNIAPLVGVIRTAVSDAIEAAFPTPVPRPSLAGNPALEEQQNRAITQQVETIRGLQLDFIDDYERSTARFANQIDVVNSAVDIQLISTANVNKALREYRAQIDAARMAEEERQRVLRFQAGVREDARTRLLRSADVEAEDYEQQQADSLESILDIMRRQGRGLEGVRISARERARDLRDPAFGAPVSQDPDLSFPDDFQPRDIVSEFNQELEKSQRIVNELGRSIARDIVDGFRNASSAADVLGSIVNRLLDRLLENAVVNPLGQFISGFVGGIGGGFNPAGAPIGAFIPGAHTGGRVNDGGLVRVGEAGPELVALPSGADIFPRGDTSDGRQVVINITNNVEDPVATTRAIQQALPQITRAATAATIRAAQRPGAARQVFG